MSIEANSDKRIRTNKKGIDVKRILLHDVGKFFSEGLFDNLPEDIHVISANQQVDPCRGCFSCWIKTPGICIIPDNAQALPSLVGRCKELIIVSRMVYGGFSPNVKAYLDRMIPCILPFFQVKNDKMIHPYRYKNKFKLTFIFYSETKAGDFLLQGQEDKPLQDFAIETKDKNEKKEAKSENKVRTLRRNNSEKSLEKIDEKRLVEMLAESVAINFGAKKYECRYVGDIINIKEVQF